MKNVILLENKEAKRHHWKFEEVETYSKSTIRPLGY